MPQLDIVIFSSEYIWLIFFLSIIYNIINISLIPNIIVYFIIEKFLNLIQLKEIILYTQINIIKKNLINIFFLKNDFILNLVKLNNFIFNYYYKFIMFWVIKKQVYYQYTQLIFCPLIIFFLNYNYINLMNNYLINKNNV